MCFGLCAEVVLEAGPASLWTCWNCDVLVTVAFVFRSR